MKQLYSILFASIFLASCGNSNVSTEWTCPANQPDNCHSVSESDAIALEALRGDSLSPYLTVHKPAPLDTQADETITAKRIDEALASIWIGAFIDDAGNYYPPAELYIVVQPARWAPAMNVMSSPAAMETIPHLSELIEARSYDALTHIYDCQNGAAVCLELLPFIGLDDAAIQTINSTLSEFELDGATLQVINWASPHIGGALARWQDARRHDQLGLTNERAQMFEHMVAGAINSTQIWRPRHYRVFMIYQVSQRADTKSRVDNLMRRLERLKQTLGSIGTKTRMLTPENLLALYVEILAPKLSAALGDTHKWAKNDPINMQMMAAGSAMEVGFHQLRFLNHHDEDVVARGYTVSKYPDEWRPGASATLIGDIFRPSLFCPWPVLTSITFTQASLSKDMAGIRTSRAVQAANSPMRFLRPEITEESKDWERTTMALSKGESLVTTLYQIVVFAEASQIEEACLRLNNIYLAGGFTIVPENGIQLPALACALPFGGHRKNLATMRRFNRTRTLRTLNAIALMPLFGEWQGNDRNKPAVMLTCGRRGELAGWTPFESNGNHNVCIIGKSGAGKSVAMQEIMTSIMATGGAVVVIDDGYSFQNSAAVFDGLFIDFGTAIELNPFAAVDADAMRCDPEFYESAMSMLVNFIFALAHPGSEGNDLERAILGDAVQYVWDRAGTKGNIDSIIAYLETRKKAAEDGNEKAICSEIITLLRPYAEKGVFGRLFSKGCSVQMHDALVVFEMSSLREKKEVQAAVMVLLIFLATQKMYHSGRDQPVAIMIDEAWSLLSGTMGSFIEGVARRTRKYNGALITATQSAQDYFTNAAAEAAWANSDWMLFFTQKDSSIGALKDSDKILCDAVLERGLRSISAMRDVYSEAIIYGQSGWDIVRIILDPVSRTAFSSTGDDVAAINNFIAKGMSRAEAIIHHAETKEGEQ